MLQNSDPGRGDVDRGPEVGEAGLAAGPVDRGDGERPRAVAGRREGRLDRPVAGGDDHHGAVRPRVGDRRRHERLALAVAPEREVDDAGGARVRRRIDDGAAGGPADPIGDVGGEPAAVAEHADDLEPHVGRGSEDADAVAGDGCDRACHVGPVPRRRLAEGRAPVPRVVGVDVAAVAVARGLRVAHHVVAEVRDGRDRNVRVVDDPGVEDGDRDAGAAAHRPRVERVDPVHAAELRPDEPPQPRCVEVVREVNRVDRVPRIRLDGGNAWQRGDPRQGGRHAAPSGDPCS